MRLDRPSTADQAADTIRGLILEGELVSGAQLRETELADSLGVSRNTIREALRTLARDGLVDQGRHRVATVAKLTPEDVADVFWMRQLLEFGAVDRIVERGERPNLSRLRAAVDEIGLVARMNDWQRMVEADRSFHDGLVALAGSPRLSAAYSQLEGEIRRGLAVTTRSHRDPADLEAQHIRLLELLEAGDYAQFKEVLGFHLTQAAERVAEVLTRSDSGERSDDD